MTEPKLANSRRNYTYAALCAAVGAYWLAVGLGLFPIPGGPSNLHGPLWLLACAGLAFFLTGIAIAFQTLGQANADGDLPAAAPRWMRALQYLIGLAIFCCFGAIATWIAFGPGERQFSGTFLFFDPATNAAIGRIAFGVGAVIVGYAQLPLQRLACDNFLPSEGKPRAG